MSMHTLVAMRYSHDRRLERPSKEAPLRQARQHGLLDGVLRFEARAEHPVAVPRQLPPEGLQIGLGQVGLTDGHGTRS